MSDWKLYAAIYFGIGLVVCLFVVAAHLFGKRKESKFTRDMMRAINPRREAFLYRMLEDFIVPALAFFLVWFVWPVVFVLKIKDGFQKKSLAVAAESELDLTPPPHPNFEEHEELAFALNDTELTRQVSIEEVERTNFIQDPMEAVPNIPFGHCNARWETFKASLQDNETLWEFESIRSELAGVQAMWGYAVRRDGQVNRFMTSGWKLSCQSNSIIKH